jgi:quercetin dioxygenase-like cupin family protein
MSIDGESRGAVTSATSTIWDNHVRKDGTPEGFTIRTTYPTNPNGVQVMLERWEPGTEEPPHSHPGDDMTVVIEGTMSIQRDSAERRHESASCVRFRHGVHQVKD